jgi:dCTP deaminase
MMKARSSLGRINVSACDDAGWGDVGYINRWTMEVRNKNREVWVPLVVGMPIAQVVFFWVENADINYAEKGNYQRSTDLSAIKASWTPDSMLPRLFSESNLELRKSISSNAELVF